MRQVKKEYFLFHNIQTFSRKLRLLEYFDDNSNENENDNTEINKSLVKKKSTFCPAPKRNKILDQQIEYLNNLPLETINVEEKHNITKSQWLSLNSLIQDKEIIIKKADKGGAVVIMTSKHYEKMIYLQLHDEQTYKKL